MLIFFPQCTISEAGYDAIFVPPHSALSSPPQTPDATTRIAGSSNVKSWYPHRYFRVRFTGGATQLEISPETFAQVHTYTTLSSFFPFYMCNPFKRPSSASNKQQSTQTMPATSSNTMKEPQHSTPGFAQFPAENFVIGGGVAIFHIATGRVVICSAQDRRGTTYYFLPKGRRDAGEESGTGAEREGYEEVRLHDGVSFH